MRCSARAITDFELIISDNASTDGTADICRQYAAAGLAGPLLPPAAQHRARPQPQLRRSSRRSGELFKWAADDDLYARDLLERCVDALDEHPDVVLAHCWTADDRRHGHRDQGVRVPADHGDSRRRRSASAACCSTAAATTTTGIIGTGGPAPGGHEGQLPPRGPDDHRRDGACTGRSTRCRDWLYFRRDHADRRRAANPTMRSRCANMDPRRADPLRHPAVRLYGEYVWGYVAAIRRAPLSGRGQARVLPLPGGVDHGPDPGRGGPGAARTPGRGGRTSAVLTAAAPPVISVDAVVAGREGRPS